VSIYALAVVLAAWGTSLARASGERAWLYTVDALSDIAGFGLGSLLAFAPAHVGGLVLALLILFHNSLALR
jgi:hypothetical protein